MPKKGEVELNELEAIFRDLKKDAKSVANDILSYIGIFRTFGAFRYIGSLLVIFALFLMFVDTYLIAPIRLFLVVSNLVYLGFGILLIYLGIKSLEYYKNLKKKYSRIIKIQETI